MAPNLNSRELPISLAEAREVVARMVDNGLEAEQVELEQVVFYQESVRYKRGCELTGGEILHSARPFGASLRSE